jgi:hypothetical protein
MPQGARTLIHRHSSLDEPPCPRGSHAICSLSHPADFSPAADPFPDVVGLRAPASDEVPVAGLPPNGEQSLKIDIALVKHVDGSRVGKYFVEEVHVMHNSAGDAEKPWPQRGNQSLAFSTVMAWAPVPDFDQL